MTEITTKLLVSDEIAELVREHLEMTQLDETEFFRDAIELGLRVFLDLPRRDEQ